MRSIASQKPAQLAKFLNFFQKFNKKKLKIKHFCEFCWVCTGKHQFMEKFLDEVIFRNNLSRAIFVKTVLLLKPISANPVAVLKQPKIDNEFESLYEAAGH